jgi:hypothetical protein
MKHVSFIMKHVLVWLILVLFPPPAGAGELKPAARSLRSLTDYLERNPRAPIFGKTDLKEK